MYMVPRRLGPGTGSDNILKICRSTTMEERSRRNNRRVQKEMDRKRKEKARELGITHHSKKEDDKQQHAEVRQDAREDDDKRKDNKIPQSIMDACNHKLRMKKVTYHSGA